MERKEEKYSLLITTKDFVDEFAQFEIEDYTNRDFKKLSNGNYEIEFGIDEEKEMFNFVYNLVYFSRVIENIYLKIIEFEDFNNLEEIKINNNLVNLFSKKEFTFEVDSLDNFNLDHIRGEKEIGSFIREKIPNLKVDLDDFDLSFKLFSINNLNYVGLDLIGFNLTKRDYKINVGSLTLNSILPNYLFYLLAIDEMDENYSIIDPASALGDISIEAASFNPRKALNIKKKNNLPIKKLFSYMVPFPKNSLNKKIKLKVYSVVQNNKVFKNQRENLNYSGQDMKISQYEIDWLDVKFKEAQINFVVSQIPDFQDEKEREEFLKEFFYQIEFIFNDAIGIISKKEIDKKHFTKNELEIQDEKKVFIGKQPYFIYVLV